MCGNFGRGGLVALLGFVGRRGGGMEVGFGGMCKESEGVKNIRLLLWLLLMVFGGVWSCIVSVVRFLIVEVREEIFEIGLVDEGRCSILIVVFKCGRRKEGR